MILINKRLKIDELDNFNRYTLFRRSVKENKDGDFVWNPIMYCSDAKSCLKAMGRFYADEMTEEAIQALKVHIKAYKKAFGL